MKQFYLFNKTIKDLRKYSLIYYKGDKLYFESGNEKYYFAIDPKFSAMIYMALRDLV